MRKWLSLLAFLLSPTVLAVDLITTLDGSPTSIRTFGQTANIAASFLTDNTLWSIESLTVRIWNPSAATGTGYFSIYDSTGASGTPGALVATIGSFAVSSLSTTVAPKTITASTPFTLNANNRYWLVGSGIGSVTRSVYWETETIDNTIGFSNYFTTTNAWSAPNYSIFTLGFTLSGTSTPIPVPEAPPWVLAAFGAGVFFLLNHLRGTKCRT